MQADVAEWEAQLASKDPDVRRNAAEQLARLGSDAQAAAAALVLAAGEELAAVRDWATAALEDLGPPPMESVARLCELAQSDRLDVAFWAVTLLGRLRDDAAPAVAALTSVLAQHAEIAVRQRAAWALGQIGPPARPAIASLESAAASDDPRLARLALKAIEQIGQ